MIVSLIQAMPMVRVFLSLQNSIFGLLNSSLNTSPSLIFNSQIFKFLLILPNSRAPPQLGVTILSYLAKFGGFLLSRNGNNGKQFLGRLSHPTCAGCCGARFSGRKTEALSSFSSLAVSLLVPIKAIQSFCFKILHRSNLKV